MLIGGDKGSRTLVLMLLAKVFTPIETMSIPIFPYV